MKKKKIVCRKNITGCLNLGSKQTGCWIRLTPDKGKVKYFECDRLPREVRILLGAMLGKLQSFLQQQRAILNVYKNMKIICEKDQQLNRWFIPVLCSYVLPQIKQSVLILSWVYNSLLTNLSALTCIWHRFEKGSKQQSFWKCSY